MEPVVVNRREAAKFMRMGESTLDALVARGEIPVCRFGRSVRFRMSDLRRYCDEHTSSEHDSPALSDSPA